jgi:bleomycin hydrolase
MDTKLRKYIEGISKVKHNKIFQNYLFDNSHDKLIKNKIKFKTQFIKIDNTIINDQGQAGTCWLYTYTNIFRRKYIKKYNLNPNFKLSISYLLFYHLYEECLKCINKINISDCLDDIDDELDNPIDDGGSFFQFRKLINKYGLVPKTIFDHSYSTKNTEELIKILNFIIRKYSIDKLYHKKTVKIERIKKLILKTLFFNFGLPPSNFDWKYENSNTSYKYMLNLTPITFLQNIDIDLFNVQYLAFYDNYKEKEIKCPFSNNYIDDKIDLYQNKTFDHNIISKIKEQILNNNPVIINCDTNRLEDNIFHHKYKNYLDLYMVDIDSLTRKEMFLSKEVSSDHVMTIIGYSDDLFLIDNSWGKQYYASYQFILKCVSVFIIF